MNNDKNERMRDRNREKPIVPPGDERAGNKHDQSPRAERMETALLTVLPRAFVPGVASRILAANFSVSARGTIPARQRQKRMRRHLVWYDPPGLRSSPLAAQTPCPDGSNRGGGDRVGFCEIRETTIADTGALNVDAGTNGGIRVTGADRSNVLIRARVQTSAPTAEEAENLATQVQVQATPGMVRD